MNPKERVIAIARKGPAGVPEIPYVLEVARGTEDRDLLRVCLDCFAAVLRDSEAEVATTVARFLGGLLRDRAYRRIRRSTLFTLGMIGAASHVVLPEITATYRAAGPSSILVPARWAALVVPWNAILGPDPAAQRAGIAALEELGSLGLLNLRSVHRKLDPAHPLRPAVQAAVDRLARKFPRE